MTTIIICFLVISPFLILLTGSCIIYILISMKFLNLIKKQDNGFPHSILLSLRNIGRLINLFLLQGKVFMFWAVMGNLNIRTMFNDIISRTDPGKKLFLGEIIFHRDILLRLELRVPGILLIYWVDMDQIPANRF